MKIKILNKIVIVKMIVKMIIKMNIIMIKDKKKIDKSKLKN
jgi:hypothetical protein